MGKQLHQRWPKDVKNQIEYFESFARNELVEFCRVGKVRGASFELERELARCVEVINRNGRDAINMQIDRSVQQQVA